MNGWEPAQVPCDACGARAGEECLPGCLGVAAQQDALFPEPDPYGTPDLFGDLS